MSELHDRLSAALSARYELKRELGRGGMAVVYLATDVKQGRQVALKVFQPDIAAAMGPKRFQREVEIATHLEHPHILSLYDSGEADGLLYYVMPYVEEESLRQRLDREGQLPIEDALRIAREMAEALDYAHEQGVVHRDVKPGNVLLQRGHALLADFGVARALEASGAEKLTGTGVSVGTPQYMAPEQVTGADAVDGRADVYAVGAVLYEMLTGEAPYTGSTPQAVLAKRMAGPPTPIPVLRETVSPDLDAIVQQAMARSAADRWQSAGELAKALAAAERGGETPIPGLSTRPGVTAEVTGVGAKAGGGKRWVGAAILAGVIASLVFGGIWFSGRAGGEGAAAENLPEPDPMLVLVVPERPSDTDEWTWTGILSDRIKRLGDLRIVDRSEAEASLASTAILPTSAADSVAATWSAGRFVLVRASEVAGEIRLNMRLYRTGDPRTLLAGVDTTVAKDHDNWAPAVVVRLFENQEKGLASTVNEADLNTGSAKPQAEIWSSRGSSYFSRGQYDSATMAYQRAVDIDSMYVEAWGRLGDAASFSTPVELHSTHDSVRAHKELAERARERFQALGGTVDLSVPSLEEARRAVAVAPNSPSAQWHLYQAMRNEYWKRGWEPDSVLLHLQEGIELDPHDSYKRSRLLVYYLCQGNAEAIERTYDEGMAFGIRGQIVNSLWPALSGLVLGSEEQRDSILLLVPESDLANIIGHRLLLVQDDMDLTARAALIGFGPRWAPTWLVYAALAAGQWQKALHIIRRDENERARFTRLVVTRAGMAGTGVLELSPETVGALRDSTVSITPMTPVETVQRLHRIGLMSAQLDDHESASAFADSLEQFAFEQTAATVVADSLYRPEELAAMAADASLEVRALDAWLTDSPEEALRMLEQQTFTEVDDWGDWSWVTARTYGRFLRAEILSELGQFEEAAGWYATIPRVKMWFHHDALLHAPVFRGRAMALDALGRHEEALHYYRRFATRWQDADPHLQPQVEEARQRIRELEAELN